MLASTAGNTCTPSPVNVTDTQSAAFIDHELFHLFPFPPAGFLRRRLIPAPLPDTSSLGRKLGRQWVDLPPLGGTLKEQFEIKVYEIDNVECVQKRKEALMGSEVSPPPDQ